METTGNATNVKAIFLDRDGTIIEDCGYVRHPDMVRLLPGVSEAIVRFVEAGFKVVVVSNQSGVARGYFGEDDLAQIHARMEELLALDGAALDGAYYCPFLDGPEAVVEAYRRDSDLRKPRPGMLLQATEELGIDLEQSWMVGDTPRDVEAGERAGCRTILVQSNGLTPADGVRPTVRVRDLLEAARWVERALEPGSAELQAQTEAAGESVTQEKMQGAAGVREEVNAPVAAQAPAQPGGSQADDAVLRSLRRIQNQLDRVERDNRQHDFSIVRLFGALLQMVAGVTALWGLIALFDHTYDAATARFALGCFLQLASITAFAVDRFR